MPSIGPFFFILGLVVASVTADEITTHSGVSAASDEVKNQTLGSNHNASTSVAPPTTNYKTYTTSTMNMTEATSTMNMTEATSTMNMTKANSTITPSITKKNGSTSLTTPKPIGPRKNTQPSTKTNGNHKNTKTTATPASVGDNTGIIILVVIILVALGFGLAFFFARKTERRYSVDFTSRPDEAHIPLSTMDPELPADTVSQNGLQTFESAETTTKEPQEPEAKPDVKEGQKAEADKSVVEPSAESAAPATSPDGSEDKPKEDVVEQSPPAPVEPSVEEKTDDESVISNKTSVESLKETNENNSNNADVSQKRDLKSSNLFWDVPLDCPV